MSYIRLAIWRLRLEQSIVGTRVGEVGITMDAVAGMVVRGMTDFRGYRSSDLPDRVLKSVYVLHRFDGKERYAKMSSDATQASPYIALQDFPSCRLQGNPRLC